MRGITNWWMELMNMMKKASENKAISFRMPEYIAIGSPDGFALSRFDNKAYFRDAGAWFLNVTFNEDGLLVVSRKQRYPLGIRAGELVYECSKEHYEDSNGYWEDFGRTSGEIK